jgi:hypothetical protein
MRILMTRLNPDRHRFTIVRSDGSTESAELETRSLLVHDLVHYAVEIEVPFREGFYGLLAKGKRLSELNDKTQPWPTGTEIAAAEGLVGPLQTMLKGEFDPAAARAQFEMFSSNNPPSIELLTRIGQRFRAVRGQYASTRFGETLELDWPEGRLTP